MTFALSFLVLLIGLVVYIKSKDADNKEIGLVMFAAGLLAFLLQSPGLVTWFNGLHR